MTAYQNLIFTIEDRVARITLNRPPLNILNIAMMKEVGHALEQCGAQKDLVAIVFDAGKDCRAFSAGVAVEEHAEGTVFQMLEKFHGIFRQLEQLSRPTISVVDGPALGGGCELLCASDIVITSEKGRFGQPEIKLGVFPPVAAVLLPRIIGERRARELILTGEILEANEALRWGLVNYLVPSAQLAQKTMEILSKFRELSGVALEFTRRSLDLARGCPVEQALKQVEDIYLHELMKSKDAVEGISAFQQKRKPVWRNR